MTTCNKEAGDKKGDERKAFMKECLAAKPRPSQQEKMKTCNKDATGKKGDERKEFMSECLKALIGRQSNRLGSPASARRAFSASGGRSSTSGSP